MRCVVLAQSLVLRGHSVRFVCRPQQADLIDFIREQGCVVDVLAPIASSAPTNDNDYAAWLGVSQQQDADEFCALLSCQLSPAIDVVMVDHYALGQIWEHAVRCALQCKLVAIDDLVRQHHVEMIIDQTIARNAQDYNTANTYPAAQHLTGTSFALLKPDFADVRGQLPERIDTLSSISILISMGGIDKHNATMAVLQTLCAMNLNNVKITVILGPNAPHYIGVAAFCATKSHWITHLDFVSNMAQVIHTHTLGIGAAGSSALERACLGLPSVVVPIADNQCTIATQLHNANAAIVLEPDAIATQLASSVTYLLEHYTCYRRNSLLLCDGLGTRRVVRQLEHLCANTLSNMSNTIQLRQARTSDIKQVFDWQCLPKTRQYALEPATPSWNEHQSWMTQKLESVFDFFYLIEVSIIDNQLAVGVVRLDRVDTMAYRLSIYIDPQYHRQGIATQALALINDMHGDVTIYATVLPDNIASQHLFTAAHYQLHAPDTFIRPPLLMGNSL